LPIQTIDNPDDGPLSGASGAATQESGCVLAGPGSLLASVLAMPGIASLAFSLGPPAGRRGPGSPKRVPVTTSTTSCPFHDPERLFEEL
jgi:hypothetical protein